MFGDIAGAWPALVDRVDGPVFDRWAQAEPALGAAAGLDEVAAMLRPGCPQPLADELLGALVRLGAQDGGDEPDAALAVVHLLREGAVALAARLDDLAPDMLGLVVGELTVQVRRYPWRRRTRAVAANLLMDTRAALLRELAPRHTCSRRQVREVLVDPTDAAHVAAALDRVVAAPGDDDARLELVDVLVWMQRSGAVSTADLRLLVALAYAKDEGGDPRSRVAREWGINERTVRRRRDKALSALHAARGAYLSACA